MLEGLGYRYAKGEWLPPACLSPAWQLAEADAMHGALMRRADALAGCTEESDEETELRAIVDAIEACEATAVARGEGPTVRGGKGYASSCLPRGRDDKPATRDVLRYSAI
jgi:hypothetical protein